MNEHGRYDDQIPKQLKWIMTFINRVGFPILVCIWLGYQQFTQGREIVRALNDFKEVMVSLKESIQQQNKLFMRSRHSE